MSGEDFKKVDDKLEAVKDSQGEDQTLLNTSNQLSDEEEEKVKNLDTETMSQIGSNIESIRKIIGFDYNPSATPPESYLKNRIDVAPKKRDYNPKKVQKIKVSSRRRSARIANVGTTSTKPSSSRLDYLQQEITRLNHEIASVICGIKNVCGSTSPFSNGRMCLFRNDYLLESNPPNLLAENNPPNVLAESNSPNLPAENNPPNLSAYQDDSKQYIFEE